MKVGKKLHTLRRNANSLTKEEAYEISKNALVFCLVDLPDEITDEYVSAGLLHQEITFQFFKENCEEARIVMERLQRLKDTGE